MKLTRVLVMVLVGLMFFAVGCGDDEKTVETTNATVCTEAGTECANNDNGKVECIDLKCELPLVTFGNACTESDHSECIETEVCIPAVALDYGMSNAETCSTINCTVVIENEQPTQSDCAEGYFCVSLEGDYSNFRPALKNATSICVSMSAK